MNIDKLCEILNRNGIHKGIIVGSRALAQYTESVSIKPTTDIDIIVLSTDIPQALQSEVAKNAMITMRDKQTSTRIEILVAHENTLELLFHDDQDGIIFASVDILYALKRGHIHRKMIKWDTHMHDLCMMKRNYVISPDCVINKSFTLRDIIAMHKKYTDDRMGKQRLPKLNVTKSEFFDDGVKKYIDHDYLHEVFAHADEPMYKKMQKDGEVLCHVDMWDSFSELDKIHAVLEECYVIACERMIIPKIVSGSKDFYARRSFMWSLMRVATDLTSGFFRDFAIDNYENIVNNYDNLYYKKVLSLEFNNENR